jgi:hypothetical protein
MTSARVDDLVDDLNAIAQLLDALRPWHRDLVIVGGWAHRLYRFHENAAHLPYQPVRTRDADLAFGSRAPLMGDIGAALKAANFHEVLSGEHRPPISEYRLGDEKGGFYAEFLAPLKGNGQRRDGTSDVTTARAGISAQRLKYLDLLVQSPWILHLDTEDVPLIAPADVMLPNPVNFIAQKLLIQKYRKPQKRAQDVLYIHDTLELFGSAIELLKVTWQDEIRPMLSSATARTVEQLCQTHFDTVTDVIRNAARIPQDRSVTPERLQATCAYGLNEIFAPL